jgi:Rps23 Pro-64 3,4-dihydroxylase Tpa1-like proline 4-hydroxylase
MMTEMPDRALYVWDPDALRQMGAQHAASYSAADPFPHVVIDNFATMDVVRQVVREFPAEDAAYWHTKRVKTSHKQDSRLLDKERYLGPFTRHLLREMNSAPFLLFLSELTGIKGLMPDPYLEGGGIHQIPRGGFLKIHADFNRHPLTNAHRRLNLLLYLNEDWRDEFGGALELWSTDMTTRVRSVAPIAGRCVVFSTTDWSFHGHPDPLQCPEGMTRKSMALYYYSVDRPVEEATQPHTTIYKSRPGEA